MRELLIVTAAEQKAANVAAEKVAGPYAKDTFSVPYSLNLAKDVTHYVACWNMSAAQKISFAQQMASQVVSKTCEIQIAEIDSVKSELVKKKLTPRVSAIAVVDVESTK